jgi:hypothetical protein
MMSQGATGLGTTAAGAEGASQVAQQAPTLRAFVDALLGNASMSQICRATWRALADPQVGVSLIEVNGSPVNGSHKGPSATLDLHPFAPAAGAPISSLKIGFDRGQQNAIGEVLDLLKEYGAAQVEGAFRLADFSLTERP